MDGAVAEFNLNGCYWIAWASGRAMQTGSVIINVASVDAFTDGGQAAFSASKAGLVG